MSPVIDPLVTIRPRHLLTLGEVPNACRYS